MDEDAATHKSTLQGDERSIEGKVALVTDAGQGIGRAIALPLANDGADIATADINKEKMQTVADEVHFHTGAKEYASDGITVNAYCPGIVGIEMW